LLAILNNFGPFTQLKLQQSVRHNSNTDINRLNIVLNCSNCLLHVLQRSVVTESLASVVNLLARSFKSVVDLSQLVLQLLNILANVAEVLLNLLKVIRVSAVVASLTLEAATQHALLTADLLKSLSGIILKPLKLDLDLG